MDHNHVLGMVCGYYLSRFDDIAYQRLGYASQQETHEALGRALQVAPESIKNWRDEFDPIHENARKGWRKREMYPSRRRTVEALGDRNERELWNLVRTIVAEPSGPQAARLVVAVQESADDLEDEGSGEFGLRGPTGLKAELAFIAHHEATQEPAAGMLIDRRQEQCGFDFEIRDDGLRLFVEVKGLAGATGGITLTDKEWATACESGDSYYLAIVRHVSAHPEVTLLRGPANLLSPKMRMYTTVQVGWSVPHGKLVQAEHA